MQDIRYLRPETLNEAAKLLDLYGNDGKVLAGGTDIIIALKDRAIICKYLIDIKAIKELSNITYTDSNGLSIGAAVCLNDIIESGDVKTNYSILVEAAKTLANSLLRNRATLIGNICNSSPGGDMLPASLVLEGRVEAYSVNGKREIPLREFFLGVKKNAIKGNEIVTRIIFPPTVGTGRYLKKSRIKGHDLAQISVGAFLKNDGTLKISLGAVAPTPILIEDFRNYRKEEITNSIKEITDNIISKIKPISDVRATKEYRITMVEYLTSEILRNLGGAN
ncbi:xanthine dehydrogenase family protein subunit M [Clostridium sp. CF012]|uniref:FAD binding domain-containing protein n=1 Tax=Clostridium sp. CF012 TaxID=2843319 RepID=UPI001C0B3E01|nr:xanthine dehydrogenase family protein subunit M [Clostridium sp. CF012]MBU3142984.1 xanthine dehydrogenase family protein subunit M [Clostridium sp. CF012]